MPSPVPGFDPRPPIPETGEGAAVQPPPQPTQSGCIACILYEDVYAPLDVAYLYDGCTFCAKHLKKIFTADPAIAMKGLMLRP